MGMFSDFLQNRLVDSLRRGGALNSGGTVNSTAVVKGIWTASTAYVVGDIVVPHANMTGAGGKFLRCTTAGTSGATNTLAVPAVGSTLTDSGVTWTAVSGMPCPINTYVGLITCNKGARANSTAYVTTDYIALTANDGKIHLYKCSTAGTSAASQSTLYPGAVNEVITDGTAAFTEQDSILDAAGAGLVEVSGGSYARVTMAATLAGWAGTQAAASTTASTGTGGVSSNNGTITFPAPSADWTAGTVKVWGWVEYDNPTGGNLLGWGPLNALQSILNGQAAPSFAAAALALTIGT
jgi:hypothetical protein